MREFGLGSEDGQVGDGQFHRLLLEASNWNGASQGIRMLIDHALADVYQSGV